MAFRTAVSGINAATANLDVTGNNVANANTIGFKNSRAQFADVYATSGLGATQNAVGQGVRVSSIAQQFNQGNVAFTNNSLDLAVNGEGFFVLDDGGSRMFTRAGTFGLDRDGFVVNADGLNLLTSQAVDGAITGTLGPLQLSSGNLPPQATANVGVGVNLDAGAAVPAGGAFDPVLPDTYNSIASLSVYDSLGVGHLARVYFVKTGVNAWDTHLRIDGDNTQTLAVQPLAFSTSGVLTSPVPIGFGAFTPSTGAAPFSLSIDLTGTTQVGATFGVNQLSQDGFPTGQLTGVDIDDGGLVLARYSNGQALTQGRVVLANFANSQGLQPVGGTNWVETNASGTALLGAPGSARLGVIQAGALEEANVDLSQELVNMIIAQRSFQANAQMIRTEDEITQTIINIR